jgi:ABC-2 type transport system permease protein
VTSSTVRAAISPLDRPRMPWPVADALAVAKRNLISMTRTPQVIVFSTVQPVLLILIFRYVFAGSMHIPGVRYTDYLVSGILVLTVAFGTQATATAVAEDLHRGLIERFRSLAMSRSALLAGRAIADTCRFLFMILLMIGAGYAVGFRLDTTALALAGAVALLLLFGFAMSWVMALLASAVRSLLLGGPTGSHVLVALAWCIGLVAV